VLHNNLADAVSQTERLAESQELLSMKYKKFSGADVKDEELLLIRFIQKSDAFSGIYVYDIKDNAAVAGFEKRKTDSENQSTVIMRVKNSHFKQLHNRKFFVKKGRYVYITVPLTGLFKQPVSYLSVKCDISKFAGWNREIITPRPLVDNTGKDSVWGMKKLFLIRQTVFVFEGEQFFVVRAVSLLQSLIHMLIFAILIEVCILIITRLQVIRNIVSTVEYIAEMPAKVEHLQDGAASDLVVDHLEEMEKKIQKLDTSLKFLTGKKTRPKSHRHIKAPVKRGSGKKSDENIDIQDLLSKAGRKTALIDDPQVPNEIVYHFEREDRLITINEKILTYTDPNRQLAEKYSSGKTDLVETNEEKKIVCDTEKKNKFVNIPGY
jgi:hypothetical protein